MTIIDEMIPDLRSLWMERITCREIAFVLSRKYGVIINKNMVIGKIHRLRIADEKKHGRSDIEMRSQNPPKSRKVKLVPLVNRQAKAAIAKSMSSAPSMIMMSLTGCKFPIGDPLKEDFRFCNEQRVEGKPYCEDHCKVAYVKVPLKKVD